MGTKVGDIYLDLDLNKKNFDSQLNSTDKIANSASEKISGSLKKIGAAVIAAFSVSAIKNFGQNLIEQAAKVNASNSQFTQTFKALEGEARASISEVAKESGILETRLQGAGSQIYAFAKSSGMDSVQSLGMMKDALQIAADSAAYYDRSLEDTTESLRSFLKGNYANDAALGVSATETTRNAAANRLYGQSFMDLSEAQKQLVLLDMVKQANAASGAMGQAAREADGWENVTGNLKEAWNQLLAAIGKPVLQGAINVVKTLTEWISKLAQWAKAASSVLGDLFGWDNEEKQEAAINAAQTSKSISQSIDNQNNLTKAVAATNAEVKRGIAGFDKLNVISKTTTGGSKDGNTAVNSAVTPSENDNLGTVKLDTKEAENNLDDLKNKIKDFFANLYVNSGLKNFNDEFQTGLDRVDKAYIGANIQRIGEDVQESAEKTALGVINMQKSFGGLAGSIAGLGATLAGKTAEFVTGGVRKWLDKDKDYIIDSTNEITGNMSSGFDNLTPIFDDLGDRAAKFFDKIRPFTEGVVADALSGITHFLGETGKFLSGGFKDGTENLQKFYFFLMDDFGPGVMKKIEDVKNWFSDMWVKLDTGFHTVVDPWMEIIRRAHVIVNQKVEDIKTWFSGMWSKISDGAKEAWQGIKDAFRPVTDWFKNTFSDAWNNVKSIFSSGGSAFKGIKEGMTDTFKNVVNGLIDGINTIISRTFQGLNSALSHIHNVEILGVKPFTYINPIDVPEIPKLAQGGIAKAPTLAVVGDNPGADSGNPEVIAPLNKLQGMINESKGDDIIILTKIFDLLQRIYELFVAHKNQGGNIFEFIANLNGNELFREMVRQNDMYKASHNGKSAFA